jgi:hypothetical protein
MEYKNPHSKSKNKLKKTMYKNSSQRCSIIKPLIKDSITSQKFPESSKGKGSHVKITKNEYSGIPDPAEAFSESMSTKKLAFEVKKSLNELKEEAMLYVDMGKRSLLRVKSGSLMLENPETLETEKRDSFVSKHRISPSNDQSSLNSKSPSSTEIGMLKQKLEQLAEIVCKSEHQAHLNHIENMRLKENVSELENKLYKIKLYSEPTTANCSTTCEVY